MNDTYKRSAPRDDFRNKQQDRQDRPDAHDTKQRDAGDSRDNRRDKHDRPGIAGKSDSRDRHDKHDRPGIAGKSDGRDSRDRHDRPGIADRSDKRVRPSRYERPDPESGDTRPRGATGALIDIDRDIMKLLVRRATLVSRIRDGKSHASSPAAIQAEKTVRTAWETNALSFSKDPQFIRQLFTLLQDLKVLTKEESDSGTSFNLAPPVKPVEASLAGPLSCRTAQMYTALAACLGKATSLKGVMLSNAMMETAKACNQVGASLTWESNGTQYGSVTTAEAAPLSFAGKTVFAGDDLFTMYLCAFAAIGRVGSCRLTGGAKLKTATLSALRNTLPLLGARLAHVVPRSQGLPATLESSGLLPDAITIPADLPLDGVCALLLAPLVWNVTITINLAELPAAIATAALAEVGSIHRDVSANVESHGSTLTFLPTPLTVPASPSLPLDPVLSSYLLALPAFSGGSATLHGAWSVHLPEAQEAEYLLNWAGLNVHATATSVTTTAATAGAFALPLACTTASPALEPLYFALNALRQKQLNASVDVTLSTDLPQAVLAQEFYTRLGLSFEEGILFTAATTDEGIAASPTWVSPNAYWSLAFALSAFIKPNLQLANPAGVTELMPPFWTIYNSLPTPKDPGVPPRKPQKDTADDTPARRRIIAG